MRRVLAVFIGGLILFICGISEAAFFQTAGEGVRPMSMGGAFTAVSNDVNALWYNPGGLTELGGKEAGISYAKLFTGITDGGPGRSVGSFAAPLGEKVGLGLGFSWLGVDVSSEFVGAVGVGISMNEKFSVGATAKLLSWSADGSVDPISGQQDENFSKSGFTLDVGLLYAVGVEGLGLGVMAKNLIPPNISQSGGDDGKLPAEIKVGARYGIRGFLAAVDFDIMDTNKLRVGGEYKLPGTDLFLRGGGMSSVGAEEGSGGGDVDFGFGYVAQKVIFDYAYVYPLIFNDTSGSHFFSFGLRF